MIITTFDTQRVYIDGFLEPKIYRARPFGTEKIILQQVYSQREFGDPEPFGDVVIDGATYGTQAETVNALNAIVYAGNSELNNSVINPLPITDVDNNLRVSRNTVFGDKITAKRIPQLAAQFQYPLAADDVKTPELTNGGYTLQENALLKVGTVAQAGSKAILQSEKTLRYIPGFECYLFATPDFSDPVDGQSQLAWVGDVETGFGFGYDGLTFVFAYRRGGVDTYFPIDLTAFQQEYGYQLNPQKGNIYLLTYGFLGYAPAKLEVIPQKGGLARLYTFEYPNLNDQTHLSQTFLPLRVEMDNKSGTTPMEITFGSINAGIVNGGAESEYTFTRAFNYFRSDVPVSGNTEIVGFRSKATFGGITNYIQSRLFNFNASQNINRESVLIVFKNPTILNTPTWQDVNPDSVLEYSEDIQIDFAASTVSYFSISIPRVGTFDKDVENLKFDLPPEGVAVFALVTAGSGEVSFSNYWKELF
jgi:hypothetical protein